MTKATPDTPVCLYCKADSDTVPLIQLRYQANEYWICPQHLPILIHKPAQLTGLLPGAEQLPEAQQHD